MKFVSLANLEYFGSKIKALLDNKMDKQTGMGLSSNDFTTDLKTKLEGIESGAQVNTVTGVKGSAEESYRTGEISISAANIGLGNVENKSAATILSELTSENVTTALTYTPVNSNLVGANSGLATLDENGHIPTSQLPGSVDEIIEAASQSAFPEEGEASKIYVALDTNLTYRWGGTAYVEISPSIALGETSTTAFRGDYGKTAYDHSQLTSGNPHNVSATDIGLGNVENKSSETIRGELTKDNVTTALGYTPLDSTDLVKASATQDGIMSKEDFSKLASIEIPTDEEAKAAIDAIFAPAAQGGES